MAQATVAAPLRITRRGRLALTAAVSLPVLAASILLASPGAQAGSEAGEPEVYTVLAGESLWDIAEAIAPNDDPRAVIDQIRSANGLSGAEVFPGDRLILPAGY
jgi:Tfp pilus assembly protein FimV